MSVSSIQEFILQNEQNFRTAAAVAGAWPSVRAQVARDFLQRLGAKLLLNLDGWKIDATPDEFFAGRWARFWIEKNTWSGAYGVTLGAWEHGRKMVFGIEGDKKRPLSSEIVAAMKPHFPVAKPYDSWDAFLEMRNPAFDWTQPEILWRMHTEEAFLDAVAEQMLTVAKATESIIDRLLQMKKSE